MRAWMVATIALCVLGAGAVRTPAQKAPTKPLAYIKPGMVPFGLWKTQPLHKRLLALLGQKEYDSLVLNMDPAGELVKTGSVLSSTGNMEHRGYEEEGVLLIDVDRDLVEVLLMHDGKLVHAYAERGEMIPLPAPVLETTRHWPQGPLRSALAGLGGGAGPTQAAAPAQAPPTRPAASGGNSVLDDINSVFGDGTSQAPAPRIQAPAGKAGAGAGSAAIAKIGATFDVAGVRLGMPAAVAEKQAIVVDARFQPRPDDFVLTDMPGITLRSGITYVQATQTTVHSLILGLTLAPKTAQVWGIGRIQTFEESELPALATTLQALRAKYGQEVARDDSEIMHQQKLIWLLDENGNRLEGAQAHVVAKACAGVGTSAQSSRGDVTSGWERNVPSSIDCSTYSFLSARLGEWPPTRRDRGGRLKAPGLLLQLEMEAMCYPLRRASYEATTMAAGKMMKQREGSEKSKAAQRVPVL